MYKFLTDDEKNKYLQKKKLGQEVYDKNKDKLDIYKEKENASLEKQFLKVNLNYEKMKEKLDSKYKKNLQNLENNLKIKKIDEIKFTKLNEELKLIFDKKIANLNEDFDVLKQNYELAKKDLLDGVENSNKYNQKIYIASIEKKFSKIDFNKQLQIKKNEITKSNYSSKDKKSKLTEVKNEIYENSNKEYKPFSIAFSEWVEMKKNNFEIWKFTKQKQFLGLKNKSFKEWLNIKIWTIPLYLLLIFIGITLAAFFTGVVTDKMIYAIAILLILSIVFGSIFAKIPIWNKYFGGALIGCMLVGSLFVQFGVLPKEVEETIQVWFEDQDFLGMYISVLLVGAVLLIPRKMIIKATGGFFALVILGTLGATILGMCAMLVTGLSMESFLLDYWLPILCDGNGGGIQPIGEIAGENGFDKGAWMSSALAVSTVASILSVIMAAVISAIGKTKPSLSGDGKLVKKDIHTVERKSEAKDRNVAVGVLLIAMIYILSDILAKAVFTKELIGILVPNFAWMIVIGIIVNLLNIVPAEIKKGVSKVNTFISKQTTWLLMFAVGMIYIDFAEFIKALNPTTLLICVAFVVGASLIPLFAARIFKFYGVESSVAAGLCMTAQGGSGAIMVLGTSDRMELMPWGQITCRIAGSIILIFAGIFFSMYAKDTTAVNFII